MAVGHAKQRRTGRDSGQAVRVLVVAAEPVVGTGLLAPIAGRLDGRTAEIFVVAPALTGSALKHTMGDVDDALAQARSRLEQSLDRLGGEERLRITGQVGDADPIVAIEDALAVFPADEIILLTRPEDEARWLERDLFDRAAERFEPEIVHVSLEREGANAAHPVEVERSGPGIEETPPHAAGSSRNTPRVSLRDLVGILVAFVGTGLLIILAANCDPGELQRNAPSGGIGSDGGCVARTIIAGAAALINVAHAVGLFLFESVGYRGGWKRLFAQLSMFGTPLAVIVSLLIA